MKTGVQTGGTDQNVSSVCFRLQEILCETDPGLGRQGHQRFIQEDQAVLLRQLDMLYQYQYNTNGYLHAQFFLYLPDGSWLTTRKRPGS